MSFIKRNKNAVIGVLTLASSIFVGEMALADVPKTINLSVDNNEITEMPKTGISIWEYVGYTLVVVAISTGGYLLVRKRS